MLDVNLSVLRLYLRLWSTLFEIADCDRSSNCVLFSNAIFISFCFTQLSISSRSHCRSVFHLLTEKACKSSAEMERQLKRINSARSFLKMQASKSLRNEPSRTLEVISHSNEYKNLVHTDCLRLMRQSNRTFRSHINKPFWLNFHEQEFVRYFVKSFREVGIEDYYNWFRVIAKYWTKLARICSILLITDRFTHESLAGYFCKCSYKFMFVHISNLLISVQISVISR